MDRARDYSCENQLGIVRDGVEKRFEGGQREFSTTPFDLAIHKFSASEVPFRSAKWFDQVSLSPLEHVVIDRPRQDDLAVVWKYFLQFSQNCENDRAFDPIVLWTHAHIEGRRTRKIAKMAFFRGSFSISYCSN